ncbi:hypothetical protein [Trinickia sp. Y13]|uniref:hypothetical protein n=1 Tax=Trinickia sp. Y13 TaxID=2917807 RepID=UPI0024076E42|nr:hypothetical protein [Trinickia sp. Y13]MDG0025766.1 hypothetical protein [Trinickia sp. Y13]
MRDQTARGPKFPVACARCGGRISEPVAFCPHCGAHARFALAGAASPSPAVHDSAPPAGGARVEPSMRAFDPADFEGDLDTPWPGPPTPLFASADGRVHGRGRAPAFRGARQWNVKGGMGLVLAAFVVLYGGVVLMHKYGYDQPAVSPVSRDYPSKAVEGSIGPGGPGDARTAPPGGKLDDSVPPDMSIANLPPPVASVAPPVASVAPAAPAAQSQAPSAPAPSPPSATTVQSQSTPAPSAPVQPAVTEGVVQTQPNGADVPDRGRARGKAHARTRGRGHANDARVRPGDTTYLHTSVQSPSEAQPQPRMQEKEARSGSGSMTRTLDGVQTRLAKNDLSGARASLAGVLAADPHNGYALSLRDQLASREQARDASLNAARACVVQSRWHCVWHNAGAALSVDASSTEAKALVDRAIIESGAATAPAGPGPDNVQVPMVQ